MSDAERRIVQRNPGVQKGNIRRMLSPSFGGELTKPFVLLDYYDQEVESEQGFSFHSHSGIATLSYLTDGELHYEDSAGGKGVLPAGSMEWMVSGGGAWHKAGFGIGRTKGIQLWVALPGIIEDGESSSQHISVEGIPKMGSIEILLGELERKASLASRTNPMNFFHVQMKAGDIWCYRPELGYQVAWLFIYEGVIASAGEELVNEVAIFEESEEMITIEAKSDAKFFFGSAVLHPYSLVVARDAIHTNEESLKKAEAVKKSIGEKLKILYTRDI